MLWKRRIDSTIKSTIYATKKKKKFLLKFYSYSFSRALHHLKPIYLFKFDRIFLTSENRKVHHSSKPVIEFVPVLLFFGHQLVYMSNSLGNIFVDLSNRSSDRNTVLKNAQVEITEIQDLPEGSSASLELVQVMLSIYRSASCYRHQRKTRTNQFGNKFFEDLSIGWMTGYVNRMKTSVTFLDMPLIEADALEKGKILVRESFDDHFGR